MTQNRYIATVVAAICLISLAACGGGGGGSSRPTIVTPAPEPTPPPDPTADPSYHLNTARFTTHQPKVLEQIGAHHAYARGLTGRGVRIGIEDDIVDYTQDAEFGNRIRLRAEDGASLAYLRPEAEVFFSDVGTCVLHDPSCNYWIGNSEGNPDAVNSWVRQVVDTEGWPTRDDSVFIVDEFYDVNDPFQRLFRWHEVPSPYDNGEHGTIVASVAAGHNLGVAPAATIIPIARNFGDQETDALIDDALQRWVAQIPSTTRNAIDQELANQFRSTYAKFDIINRSYGRAPTIGVFLDEMADVQWHARYLPKTLEALWQTNTPDSQKTIVKSRLKCRI